jgi:hypothetical protein
VVEEEEEEHSASLLCVLFVWRLIEASKEVTTPDDEEFYSENCAVPFISSSKTQDSQFSSFVH